MGRRVGRLFRFDSGDRPSGARQWYLWLERGRAMENPRLAVLLLLVLGCSGSQSHPLASDPSPFTAPVEPRTKGMQLSAPRAQLALRHIASRAGLLVGVALARDRLIDPIYAETAAREFNYVTAENAMKWSSLEPQRGVWNFGPADAIVAFAEEHKMAI